jgi:hypothetical protein
MPGCYNMQRPERSPATRSNGDLIAFSAWLLSPPAAQSARIHAIQRVQVPTIA